MFAQKLKTISHTDIFLIYKLNLKKMLSCPMSAVMRQRLLAKIRRSMQPELVLAIPVFVYRNELKLSITYVGVMKNYCSALFFDELTASVLQAVIIACKIETWLNTFNTRLLRSNCKLLLELCQ